MDHPIRSIQSAAELTALLKDDRCAHLVYFTAVWCGPCRRMTGPLETLARESATHVDISKIDIDALPQIAAQYRIEAVPTFILFKQGRGLGTVQGANLTGVRELLQYC